MTSECRGGGREPGWQGRLEIVRGIEVGQIFLLRTGIHPQ